MELRPSRGPLVALALCLLALEGLVLHATRPAAPVVVGAGAFSEERAWPVLRGLVEDIGPRPAGSVAQARAADFLVAQLEQIPGIEILRDDAHVTYVDEDEAALIDFRAHNVLARLVGRSPDALLLSAHYDSAPTVVGAGDNGIAVAALVEIARVLAREPRHARTVIFNLNDAEEAGLLGARGFLDHPWKKDVRAFINLDAAGTRGKAMLFRASGSTALVAAFARTAPQPLANVVGQDLFRLVPSETDFRVYDGPGGLPGLDLALYEDGYAYHTALDRLGRVEPGTLAQVGGNALASTRALLDAPALGGRDESTVFYDVLGRVVLHYGTRRAGVFALGAALAGLLVLTLFARRHGLSSGRVLASLAQTLLVFAAGLGAAWALAAVLALLRPHGWYAHPLAGVLAFGGMALAAALGVHARWARRRPGAAAAEALVGSTLLWMCVGCALGAAGLGSGYLALWSLLGLVGTLLVAQRRSPPPATVEIALLAPGALLWLQTATSLVRVFVPICGRTSIGIPLDPVIATVVAISTLALVTSSASLIARAHPTRRAALAALLVALIGAVACASLPRYTPERPQRVQLTQRDAELAGRLSLMSDDGLPVVPLRGPAPAEARYEDRGWTQPSPRSPRERVEVRTTIVRTDGEGRTVELRVEPRGASRIRLSIPSRSILGWSLSAKLPPEDQGMRRVIFLSPSQAGLSLQLELRGAAPIAAELEAEYFEETEGTMAWRALLPAEATVTPTLRTKSALSL